MMPVTIILASYLFSQSASLDPVAVAIGAGLTPVTLGALGLTEADGRTVLVRIESSPKWGVNLTHARASVDAANDEVGELREKVRDDPAAEETRRALRQAEQRAAEAESLLAQVREEIVGHALDQMVPLPAPALAANDVVLHLGLRPEYCALSLDQKEARRLARSQRHVLRGQRRGEPPRSKELDRVNQAASNANVVAMRLHLERELPALRRLFSR